MLRPIPAVPRRIGFAFHPSFLAHDTGPGHPERPQRLTAIYRQLQANKLLASLVPLDPPPASSEILQLVHSAVYAQKIEQACRQGQVALDPDTHVSPGSWDAALRAVGAVTLAVDQVCSGALQAAFCAVRPPGHHALRDQAMGFCIFNNVAIGACYAQRHCGLSRVLIVDWDAHHGNGTEAIFVGDESILYFSAHQSPFYPGTGMRSQGNAVNVPLGAGAGDAKLLQAFREHLLPRAAQFKPELILISAGFDAHREDPLARLQVTTAGYGQLTHLVRELAEAQCGGRIVSVLEGGYHLPALAASVEAHLQALLRS